MGPKAGPHLPPPSEAFGARKAKILEQLAVPDAEYTDASPKGSVDVGIRDLIADINGRSGLATTSSCAGRVSVYLEGKKGCGGGSREEERERKGGDRGEGEGGEGGEDGLVRASTAGGKGGGEWLFVSHDPVELPGGEGGDGGLAALFLGAEALPSTSATETSADRGQQKESGDRATRLIHFKFEPMVSSLFFLLPLFLSCPIPFLQKIKCQTISPLWRLRWMSDG
jgi:tRNA wybutosine-synthesizing protein 3